MKLITLFSMLVIYFIATIGMWTTLNTQAWIFWFIVSVASLIVMIIAMLFWPIKEQL